MTLIIDRKTLHLKIMNVDISEIQVRGGGRGDDDLEEGEEPLREEHQ